MADKVKEEAVGSAALCRRSTAFNTNIANETEKQAT
jgi:hypothetical protein